MYIYIYWYGANVLTRAVSDRRNASILFSSDSSVEATCEARLSGSGALGIQPRVG